MPDHVSKKLNNAPVIVTLKAGNNNNEFKLRDLLTQAEFSSQRAKRELLAFFACLSDEAALQSEDYTLVGGQLYGEDDTDFERGLVIRGGVRRGIRIPDGKNHLEAPLYVVDVRNCAFYKDQTMVQSLSEVADRLSNRDRGQILQHFLRLYRGVRCRLTYAPHEMYTIEAYGREARDIEIPQPDGPPVSMADHFRTKYNVRLADDSVPTIRLAGDTTEYPLDVLEILPHQRVRVDVMDEYMANVLLDLNSPDGQTRVEELKAHTDAILGPTSASLMAAFGIATSYPTAVPHTPNKTT
ncbi:PAZ domain-containing protein [Aphelenchoides avenae]|nr:PAZ domain-containing protein [Aphelenchus avenae]